jgi:hypothetical protein
MARRSDAVFVSFADCTASSRMRWRRLVASISADSAVCASEMPSFAFLTA